MTKNELVVVKHGSAVVEHDDGVGLDQVKIDFHVRQHMRLRAKGFDTTEVASGAVVEGKEYVIHEMGENIENFTDDELAVFGTARQLQHWEEAARPYGWAVGQVLVTHEQIDDDIGELSPGEFMVRMIRNATWAESLIVSNENHAAAAEEIWPYIQGLNAKVRGEDNPEADNDWLAAHLAMALGAKTLLLLTDVDGLMVNGKVVPELSIYDIPEMLAHCKGDSESGKGGMKSKLLATERAVTAGIEVIIGNAFTDVRHLIDGEAGTRVVQ
jgi:glutamate 5-kinase